MKQTTLAYIENGKSTLLLYRNKKKNDENAGKWIGVGGKFLAGESPEECMLREVYEETGLTPTSYRYRGIVTFVSGDCCEYMHLFTVSEYVGTLTACDEGELAFIENEKIGDLPMWEGDRVFFDLLKKDLPFFSLKLVYSGERLNRAILNGEPL